MDAESYWAGYLAARLERFSNEKKLLIGAEYNSNPSYWNEIIHQEWAIMKSRLELALTSPIALNLFWG